MHPADRHLTPLPGRGRPAAVTATDRVSADSKNGHPALALLWPDGRPNSRPC